MSDYDDVPALVAGANAPALIALRAFCASTFRKELDVLLGSVTALTPSTIMCASTHRTARFLQALYAPVLIVATLTLPTIMCASTLREELDVLLRKCVGLDVRLR